MSRPVVLAAAAHPDDIEFMMAGTLLLLAEAGCEIHMWNLCNGGLGSMETDAVETAGIRAGEARESARQAGATWHPPLFNDLEIFYDAPSLARVAAVAREIRPNVVLTHPPLDYMEDHQNVCRLIVSGVFTRGMPNFPTEPSHPATDQSVCIYHALPHGLRGPLREEIQPHGYVDVSTVIDRKETLLACHESQKAWLDATQGMDAYLKEMRNMTGQMGSMSGRFEFAEGWTRHSHLGLGGATDHPLRDLLGDRYHSVTAEG